jgi:hypothetical protein
MLTLLIPLQSAVRNLHREACETVEKVRKSCERPHTPLRADELDRLSGMTRHDDKAASDLTPVMPERLATDYRAISGLDVPMSSRRSSAASYSPPDPRLVEQMEMVSSGASASNRAFSGEEDFGAGAAGGQGGRLQQPQHAPGRGGESPQPSYILDASWHDFVGHLGF